MTVKIIGVEKLADDLELVRFLLSNLEIVTEELDVLMTRYAPVRTGFLKSTIYYKHDVAGADAPYAGFVEEMGGRLAYATKTIKSFKIDKFADKIWEPLDG